MGFAIHELAVVHLPHTPMGWEELAHRSLGTFPARTLCRHSDTCVALLARSDH